MKSDNDIVSNKKSSAQQDKPQLPGFMTESPKEGLARFYKRFGPLVLTREEDLDDRLKEWRKAVPNIDNMTHEQWKMLCDILDEIQKETS